MQGLTAFGVLALAVTTWAASPLVDCSKYYQKGRGLACTREIKPICGTDQETYANECMLCMRNKEKGLQLRKLHDNICIECTKYSEVCTMEFIPHCGSNGQVYGNKCLFCNAVMKSRGELTLANYGLC